MCNTDMLKFLSRHKLRLLVCLFLFVCAYVAILLFCFPWRHGPFWDKYQKVQLGMNKKEVEAILGPAMYEDWPGGFGAHVCWWDEGEQRIIVSFRANYSSGETFTYKKWFHPKTTLEKLGDFFDPEADSP